MTKNLADALADEQARVRELRDEYASCRGMPMVNVEPALVLMDHALSQAEKAAASGDVLEVMKAYNTLMGFE